MSVKPNFRNALFLLAVVILMTAGRRGMAQATPAVGDFPPLELWKSAVISGDAAALKALYSADPPAQITANGVPSGADADLNFWLGLKARSMQIEIVRLKSKPDAESVIFQALVRTADGKMVNVTDAQGWRNQGGQWRLAGAERTDAPHLQQPSHMNKNIYPDNADAHAELLQAEHKAALAHKRVLLVFGANWCYDCHVLDLAFRSPALAPVLEAGFVLLHVDLGPDGKKNDAVVKQFDVTLDKGIPVLAVIEGDGTLVASQKNGEFEDARSLTSQALLEFLNRWKPQ